MLYVYSVLVCFNFSIIRPPTLFVSFVFIFPSIPGSTFALLKGSFPPQRNCRLWKYTGLSQLILICNNQLVPPGFCSSLLSFWSSSLKQVDCQAWFCSISFVEAIVTDFISRNGILNLGPITVKSIPASWIQGSFNGFFKFFVTAQIAGHHRHFYIRSVFAPWENNLFFVFGCWLFLAVSECCSCAAVFLDSDSHRWY